MSKQFLTINYSQPSFKTLNSPSCKSADVSRSSFNHDDQTDVHYKMRQLKQKAHKSFMQVMHMQSLHQQEIQLLRKQYYEEEQKFKKRQAQLQRKLSRYEGQSGENKKFILQLPNASFSIDNIQAIDTEQQDDSRLQDSSILNIRQLLSQRDSASHEKIKLLQNDIKRQLLLAIQKGTQDQSTKGIVDKVFSILSHITNQNYQLRYKLEDSNRNVQLLQNNLNKAKLQCESSQKQIHFLSQHFKKVHNDKINFEKRNAELQRNKRSLQDAVRGFKKILSANNINANEAELSLRRKNSELLSCVNQDLNISGATKSSVLLGGSTKLMRMTSQNEFSAQKGFNASSSIKNFRKKESFYKLK